LEAQGFRDWLAIISRGCQLINLLTGSSVPGAAPDGVTPAALSAAALSNTAKELAELRKVNEQMLWELRQIRRLDPSDPPELKKLNEKKAPSGAAPQTNPPSFAGVDRDLSDIAAMQQEIAAKGAKLAELRAARKAAPNGTGVAAGNR
jgi:hypothetical protein